MTIPPTSEGDLVAALQRMARDTDVPPLNPESERALLTAFDAAWEKTWEKNGHGLRTSPRRWSLT